ncbi:MAG: hypothetical protein ACC682_17655, partial [Gemmatimonadota bacterium]
MKHGQSRMPLARPRGRPFLRPLAVAHVLAVVLLGAAACTPAEPESGAPTVVNDAAMADETSGENWLAFGRTYSEQRFSPLTQIDDS